MLHIICLHFIKNKFILTLLIILIKQIIYLIILLSSKSLAIYVIQEKLKKTFGKVYIKVRYLQSFVTLIIFSLVSLIDK